MADGRLFLVGIGPGAAGQMSQRAREVIDAADVVVGYSGYLDLIADLLPGKQAIRKGMTEELQRARAACEQARAGKTVALVSSGDVGIYGMAGLAYEWLLQSGWRPGRAPAVEVVPGITALSACAALVGAPLSHDFCAVSLSDLLTPWPAIARRLDAAARADFVIALYNPKSRRRQGQIDAAQRILLRHRPAATPVAIVEAAYRAGQTVQLVTLAEMVDCEMSMLTTVLIGNAQSYCQAGLMLTPRGYANKYVHASGIVRDGEASGRPLRSGLEGWPSSIRRHLRDTAPSSLELAARALDVPIGDVLAAIGTATDTDTAGGFRAVRLRAGAELTLLEAARDWGAVRLLVPHGPLAATELALDVLDIEIVGDRLVVVDERFRLQINRHPSQQAWLVRGGTDLLGLYLVESAGDLVIKVSPDEQGREPSPAAMRAFEHAWQRFGRDDSA